MQESAGQSAKAKKVDNEKHDALMTALAEGQNDG